MKKNLFWILTAAALLSVSCNKEMKQADTPIREEGKAQGLEVRATLPSESKSRLDTDGLTLLWEESDKIAMWATPVGHMEDIENGIATLMEPPYSLDFETALTYEVINRYSSNLNNTTSDVLRLVSGAGNSTATFASSKNSIDWFDQSETDGGYSWFTAIYPAPETLPQWYYYAQFINQINMYLYQPYLLVEIPTVQDGKSYWKYQLLLDRGTNDRPEIPGEEQLMPTGIVSKGELTSGEYELNLSDWTVETSLLEFTVTSGDGNDYEIDHIDITMEFTPGGYDDCFALSGKLPLFFVWDEEKDNTLWTSFGDFTDHYFKRKSDASHWSVMDDASNKVTLKFDEPLRVGSTVSETIYAVMAPTTCTYNIISGGTKPKMVFSAYDANNKLVLQKRLEMQNTFTYTHSDQSTDTCYPGTLKGTKYSFALTLDPTLHASFAGPSGNMSIEDLQSRFPWQDADKIALCVEDENEAGKYYYETVTIDENGLITIDPALNARRAGYAIYPASAAVAYPGPDVDIYDPYIKLPDEYTFDYQSKAWGANEYPSPMIAVNDPSTNTLQFHTVCSALKVTLEIEQNVIQEGDNVDIVIVPGPVFFGELLMVHDVDPLVSPHIDVQQVQTVQGYTFYVQGNEYSITNNGQTLERLLVHLTNVPEGANEFTFSVPATTYGSGYFPGGINGAILLFRNSTNVRSWQSPGFNYIFTRGQVTEWSYS